jgi:hypothetical protein
MGMCFQKNKLKKLIQMNENKTNINWDSGANRQLSLTIDISDFQKNTSCSKLNWFFCKKFKVYEKILP